MFDLFPFSKKKLAIEKTNWNCYQFQVLTKTKKEKSKIFRFYFISKIELKAVAQQQQKSQITNRFED